ncbi:MAG: hypothetical protein KF768_00030 [Phycisphaeraceae bacterium]|nr:hypothetical protein [Phycisphaeraceae bacterium]
MWKLLNPPVPKSIALVLVLLCALNVLAFFIGRASREMELLPLLEVATLIGQHGSLDRAPAAEAAAAVEHKRVGDMLSPLMWWYVYMSGFGTLVMLVWAIAFRRDPPAA